MRAIADVVEANLEELAKLEASDVGKPISDARGEVGGVVECFRCYAVVVDKILDETTPVDGDIDIDIDMTFREPLDVVAVIAPWDFPLPVASWNIAPALAAGNSVIVMPTQLTPLSTRRPPHAGAVRQHTPMPLGHHTRVTSFLTATLTPSSLAGSPVVPSSGWRRAPSETRFRCRALLPTRFFGPIAANIWF